MRNYKKWILFTKYPDLEFKDLDNIYVLIGMNKNNGCMDWLEFRENVEILGIYPCVDKGVTLRIYWRDKKHV